MEPGSQARILVVDDADGVRITLVNILTAVGYHAFAVADGAAALTAWRAEGADLVLLDLNMPGMDGFAVLKALREQSAVPVIVLSGREDEESKVQALDMGADDYVTKPFLRAELLARLRAALRRPAIRDGDKLVAGTMSISRDQQTADVRGRTIRLAPMEYRLLMLLAERAGQVLTVRQLVENLWGRDDQHQRQALRVLVRKLRSKLERAPEEPQLIVTDPGVGYRLLPPEQDNAAE